MKCPECGMKIPNYAKRCPYCHTQLDSVQQLFGAMHQAKDDYKKGAERGEKFAQNHPVLTKIIVFGLLVLAIVYWDTTCAIFNFIVDFVKDTINIFTSPVD